MALYRLLGQGPVLLGAVLALLAVVPLLGEFRGAVLYRLPLLVVSVQQAH